MYPLGLAPTGTTGTTPEGLQTIIFNRYGGVGGKVAGCAVRGLATMDYQVDPGAVVVVLGPQRAVEVPIATTLAVPTKPAPSTGSRTDYVVVNGDTDGTVSVTQRPPAQGTVIAQFTVPAGVTSTKACLPVVDNLNALPVSSPMGPLVPRWYDPAGDGVHARKDEFVWYQATLPLLPTDRWVEITITQHLRSDGADPLVNDLPGSMMYTPSITNFTGPEMARVELSYRAIWEPKQYTWRVWLLRSDTPSVLTIRRNHRYGADPIHFQGSCVDVIDRGAAH